MAFDLFLDRGAENGETLFAAMDRVTDEVLYGPDEVITFPCSLQTEPRRVCVVVPFRQLLIFFENHQGVATHFLP